MSLTLHFHPLSSFCWKALIALYENDTPFTPNLVDLGNEAERAALLKLWPIGKFPVLRDDARDQTVPEFEHHHRISRPALSRRARGSSPPIRTSRGRRGCATASTISMCICRCRRSWATGCAPRGRRIRMASKRRGRSCGRRYRHDRGADGGRRLGDGRRVQPRRLRRACRRCSTATWSSRSATTNKNVTAYFERLKARPRSRAC